MSVRLVRWSSTFVVLSIALGVAIGIAPAQPAAKQSKAPSQVPSKTERTEPTPFAKRKPWTTSRVTGSPEPPPPYRTERVFTHLKFNLPVALAAAPGSDRMFVVEQEGKIFSFVNNPTATTNEARRPADLLIDLKIERTTLTAGPHAKQMRASYGLAFHPQFAKNRYCYICYTVGNDKGPLDDGTRVSRFTVSDGSPPTIDPASEEIVLTWREGGHNGGCLAFGPDGMLYISSGDGGNPNPPDPNNTGQNLDDLMSCVLRIDVDRRDAGRNYAIPGDNPFVKTAGARGEIWAYGFRNPWKMSFDRATGDLWVGDVGWELWEMIYRVTRGGNYGWSIVEGPQSVRGDVKQGPTPIIAADDALPHSISASVTGGYVYRGKRLPELVGHYVYGDWETRRLWSAKVEEIPNPLEPKKTVRKLAARRDITQPSLRLIAFGEDNAGELYLLDYDDGTIARLVANEAKNTADKFPRKLSETGLFSSLKEHKLAEGVVPFTIAAQQWSDGAAAQRFIALPGDASVGLYPRPIQSPGTMFDRVMEFPKDAVLGRTLLTDGHDPFSALAAKPIETQLLHFDGRQWQGYSYAWNSAGTDAVLVDAEGAQHEYQHEPVQRDRNQRRTWNYPSRTQCLQCHNPWARTTLAFNEAQLTGAVDGDSVSSFERLKQQGVIVSAVPTDKKSNGPADPVPKLVDPYDAKAEINLRGRSYLHVNCAHCHRFGGGGSANIELVIDKAVEDCKLINVPPTQGTFGINDAQVIAAGDPDRSVLLYRMLKLGRGRMPHIGSDMVDERGVRMLRQYIEQLPRHPQHERSLRKLIDLSDQRMHERELATYDRDVEQIVEEMSRRPDASKQPAELRDAAVNEWTRRSKERAAIRSPQRAAIVKQLLSDTTSAMILCRAVNEIDFTAERSVTLDLRAEIVAAAMAHTDPAVRDLFEEFVPHEQRVKRLGEIIRPEMLLRLAGDTKRGEQLFKQNTTAQCKTCHRIGDAGGKVGPELTLIAKRLNKAQLLESLLEPNKSIDPKFVTQLITLNDGRTYTGVVVSKDAGELVLRDAADKEIRIPIAEIDEQTPQSQSMMPAGLLRDMTTEQAADLLEYLYSLK